MCDATDATSPVFQPFFLDFYKVHTLATNFFLRMWNESGAAIGDFTRVVALVRSQYVFPPSQEPHYAKFVLTCPQSEGRAASRTPAPVARGSARLFRLRVPWRT